MKTAFKVEYNYYTTSSQYGKEFESSGILWLTIEGGIEQAATIAGKMIEKKESNGQELIMEIKSIINISEEQKMHERTDWAVEVARAKSERRNKTCLYLFLFYALCVFVGCFIGNRIVVFLLERGVLCLN